MATPNLGLTNDYAAGDPYPAAQANAVADAVDAAWPGAVSLAIAVGAQAGDDIAVAISVLDGAGDPAGASYEVGAWLVDTQDADAALTAAAPNGGWTAATGTLLYEPVADKYGVWVTDATGALDIEVTESGTGTWYLVARLGARLWVSDAITFA